MLLAIETSGPVGSLALRHEGAVREVRPLQLGGRHGQTLLPEIERLLRDHQLSPGDLNTIAVGLGPGSYTGLRIGVVCAKTLAFAVGCPLVGVDTLRAIALAGQGSLSAHAAVPTRIWVIADALRGRLYTGCYELPSGTAPVPVVPPSVQEIPAWLPCLAPGDWLSGPAVGLVRDTLPNTITPVPDAFHLPQATEIGRLAEFDLAAGITHDPATLVPVYLRESSAETQWDKLHGGRR